jgi:hypothetical protein
MVAEWARMHQRELMEDWYLARRQDSLNEIAPLEQPYDARCYRSTAGGWLSDSFAF